MYRCEDFPCCGHYDEGGPERGIPYCPNPDQPTVARCIECGGPLPPHGRFSICTRCAAAALDDHEEDRDLCDIGEHEYEFDRQCGAHVCVNCDVHRGMVRCFCGWSASGPNVDGCRELILMGENLDEDY